MGGGSGAASSANDDGCWRGRPLDVCVRGVFVCTPPLLKVLPLLF